jgi:thiol-disulfide isomerase/thioredoxin
VSYADWNADRARYAGTDVVLFFHASWCPKCRDTEASAKSGMPAGLTLVKIDYDDATSLRQQYGVTLQHTFVQVDGSAKAIKKWVGTYDDNSVAWVKAQTV